MKLRFSERADKDYPGLPVAIRKALGKQLGFVEPHNSTPPHCATGGSLSSSQLPSIATSDPPKPARSASIRGGEPDHHRRQYVLLVRARRDEGTARRRQRRLKRRLRLGKGAVREVIRASVV